MDQCTHLKALHPAEPLTPEGCGACIALGDAWVHLRMCMDCGHVGCCDSSENKHASKHAHAAGHPVMRTLQAGEDWMWCVVDERNVGV